MAAVRSVFYPAAAGLVGGVVGILLTPQLSPFWAWSIAGLIMGAIILVGSERPRHRLAVAGTGVIMLAVVAGGLASLIYRL